MNDPELGYEAVPHQYAPSNNTSINKIASSFIPKTIQKCMNNAVVFSVLLAITLVLFICSEYLAHLIAGLLRYYVEVELNDVSVSPLKVSDSHLRASWNVTLTLRNPNGRTIFYNMAKVSVYYKQEHGELSEAYMSPFNQEEYGHSLLQATLVASYVPVSNDISKAVKMARNCGKTVDFRFEVEATVMYEEDWVSRGWIRASCEPVKIKFLKNSTEGKMAGEPIKCKNRYMNECNLFS